MKCHHCDNQATVHLTQILNGQMHKMDLCESCAQAKGVTNPENLSISNLMDKVDMDTDNSGTAMVCESCGTTHQEFKKGGRLGCEACYHVFRPVLDPCLMVCMQESSIWVKYHLVLFQELSLSVQWRR